MKKETTFIARAIAAAALLSLSQAYAAPEVSANIELDNTVRGGTAVAEDDRGISQSGRVEVNLSSKAGADVFVAAKTAFLAKKDGTLGTDDMWIQLGNSMGAIKLGRFEGADLFPLAQDTLVNHAGNVYTANTLRGRKDGDAFHAAGTFNLSSSVALELGVVSSTITTLNKDAGKTKGLRPVLSYKQGPINASLGIETGDYASGNKVRGTGITAGYDFGTFKIQLNLADGLRDADTDNRQYSYGATLATGPLAVGYVVGETDQTGGKTRVQTAYASYNIPLFGIKGASMTPGLSMSTKQDGVAGTSVREDSVRLRFNYAF